jgi:transcriptional regulator with XRE-family HTH domain
MTTTLNCGANWFSDRWSSTGAIRNVLATALLVGVGTGAHLSQFPSVRQIRANETFLSPFNLPIFDATLARTPAEDVARIREVLSPGISNLAGMLGVSRQTVYNWLNGEQPASEHSAKLQDMAQAADLLAEFGTPISGALLKRKVIRGKTLFEVISEGGSAHDSAQILVQILRREQEQRKHMAARLAGRASHLRSAESDFPAAND